MKVIQIKGEDSGRKDWVRYTDPDTAAKLDEKNEMFAPPTIPVDMEYGFIPTKTSQEAKQSSENLQATMDAVMERFGLK